MTMTMEPLPAPTTQFEERQQAMGILLGILDTARHMTPPSTLTPIQTLATWSCMVEMAVAEAYGADWRKFVAHEEWNEVPEFEGW
jgi:hypothetical protein